MLFKKNNEKTVISETKRLKVGAVSPKIRLCDVAYNVEACAKEAKRASEMGVQLLVFPKLTLTGATCGDLFTHSLLGERAERGVADFMKATSELDTVCVIGAPGKTFGEYYAVVYKGTLLGLYTSGDDLDYSVDKNDVVTVRYAGQRTELLDDGLFTLPYEGFEDIDVALYDECIFDGLISPRIIINPEALETIIGSREENLKNARDVSSFKETVYVLANAGVGESTTDVVYSAHNIIAKSGEILAEAMPFALDNLIASDVTVTVRSDDDLDEDFDAEDFECSFDELCKFNEDATALVKSKVPKLNKRRDFFLPEGQEEQRIACLEALEIQAQGLAARIERSYSKAMVIGVSGGLDSTLALLVCARAADILEMDRKNIVGVTMPCFGTTKRTKSNAEKLCEALGTTLKVVDIKASVTQHLKDIGHDGVTPDVTYENAQARERTQVIMDIANMTGGLVVGTGDLSELALGWATYNGDHMSMYAVNASVPKTMVRRITEVYSSEHKGEGEVSAILDDILATPVSPELLPPKDGEIAQCTEALVGPYELHDYFLYHLLARQMSPRIIYQNAKYDFEGVYDNETILGWLRVFMRRFFSQQFKRSCLPDGPKVSCISVSPRCGLSMPSDASAAVWLEELDRIEKEEK